jgi:PAS domain S-box-containing protein
MIVEKIGEQIASQRKYLKPEITQQTIRELSRKKSRAEQALRDSEQRYRDLINTAPDLICTVDLEGRFTSLNPAFTAIHGWPISEWLGKPFQRLVHPEDRLRAEAAFADALQGKMPAIVEARCLTSSGGYVHVEVTSTPQVREGNVVGVLAIVHNVTERKHLEEQYRQAQRMEAVGTLAGGVAHDFNNLLTAIMGFSELLVDGLREDEGHCQLAREIRRAGDRAVALTRQLLAFSRKHVLAPVSLNLNSVVGEMEKMLRRLIGEDIDFATMLEPALGRVHADPGQIEQVLMNLVVNSRDAMPRGGQLTIATRNVTLDESFVRNHRDIKPGPYILFSVTDTGCGISPKNKKRIFEPFFTTKGPGKGTGLGLAIVSGIVKQSGGEIEVESELGQGATFYIFLPRIDEQAPQAKPEASKVPCGSETVLLVEDDDGARCLTRMALEAKGYTILESKNGTEALRLQAEFEDSIALLITDVVMPHMSGRELADRLTGLRPELKVLYVSGYLDDALVRHGIMESRMAFLQKPYSPAALARKVREILDNPAPKPVQIEEASPKELFIQSLERCKKVEDFIPRFYQGFMASSPRIAERFRFTDFGRQNAMVLHSLELAADATVGKPQSIRELTERARSHDRNHLNIQPELYDYWLDELVATARDCDLEWTDQIEAAWRRILGHVTAFMKARY